jgi:hypothetical protein
MLFAGWINEHRPTIGGGTIHVVIPPQDRRPWPDERFWWDEMPPSAAHRHPFGMYLAMNSRESSRVR